ncbi:hypothetical protein BGZ83_007146 [Gryganskiella cystojenkinii]|nr:hypothetical protein BGZ83_007146 [Gryganskiella cystojenkinii]
MRFTFTASVAAIVTMASVIHAQDATCAAVLPDYTPGSSGAYQKCYTDQVYNSALVAGGASPNYHDIINSVCSKTACSHSTLQSAETKYIAACNASINAEATGGNILSLGKNALYVFFAEPLRGAICALDPNAFPPTVPSGQTPPPQYCLASSVTAPANRFVSQLALYLTGGSLRSSSPAFFTGLDPKDVCSDCSKIAMNSTIEYLSNTLMPAISPFYTPEFVQFWTKAVPTYNTMCKSSFTQTWPAGTLNVTVPGLPTPTPPATALPTSTTTSAPSPTHTNGAGALKPVAAVATAMIMAVAAFF